MKNLLLALALVAIPTAALSDSTQAQKEKAAVPAKDNKPVSAVRLSDAELDKITAGTTTRIIGDGITFVFNPGRAAFLKTNNNRIVGIF
jgi:hypothetical protein